MNTTELKQKLHLLVDTAEEKKLMALYTIMENDIEQAQPYWEDEEFVAGLEHKDRDAIHGMTPRQAAQAMQNPAGR